MLGKEVYRKGIRQNTCRTPGGDAGLIKNDVSTFRKAACHTPCVGSIIYGTGSEADLLFLRYRYETLSLYILPVDAL